MTPRVLTTCGQSGRPFQVVYQVRRPRMSHIGVLGRIAFLSALLLMPMLACESPPTEHSPVPPAVAPPPAELKSVSVSGQVIDADREAPVPGATVSIDRFTSASRRG